MSFLRLYADDLESAALNTARTPAPAKPAKTSVWTAIPRAVGEAVAQGLATTAEVVAGYGDVMGRIEAGESLQSRQPDMSSGFAEALRARGRSFRPDAATASTAEQVLYGFTRGATKVVGGAVVGGPLGVVAAGAEEARSSAVDLMAQGVDDATAGLAGVVQGAGLGLAALPAAGPTLATTLGLYAAGGPGGFVAQQALTREILQRGGYDKLAEQYDPFDPVGLAVSSLVPAPFAAWGLRQARVAAAVKSLQDVPLSQARGDVPPAEPAAPAVAEPIPSARTPIADAIEAYPREVEDAARVALLAEQRRATNPARADDLRAAEQHEAALARAEDQIASGERVEVADVAPPAVITGAEREANFRAWFGDSAVRNYDGSPLVVYHGTGRNFDAFSTGNLGDNTGVADAREGFFFSSSGQDASEYAWKDGEPGQVMPVYLSIQNPYVTDFVVTAANNREFAKIIRDAKAAGHDGVAAFLDTFGRESTVFVAFKPEQIKSAVGNSGRFDPNSPSLTDPLADFAERLRAGLAEAQANMPRPPTDATQAPKAPDPEAAAPARGDGAAQAERPAGTGDAAAAETAGLTPGEKVEASAAQARIEEIRAQFPDLMVQMDGMDAPVPLEKFLADVKAEADEMVADVPLYEVAAGCALTFGT